MRSLRVIRVFISSTFADMQRERTLLQSRVFPAVRRLCVMNDWRFEAIDLRWGITAQQTANNLTLDICLAEVERCRNISPRPNLLILSGQRYGWIPLPDHLPVELFNYISQEYSAGTQTLRACYRLDENSMEPLMCLLPLTVTTESQRAECERIFDTYACRHPEFREQYRLSATEREIQKGLLENTRACDTALLYHRQLNDIPAKAASIYSASQERQDELTKRVKEIVGPEATLEINTSFDDYDSGAIDDLFVEKMTTLLAETATSEMNRYKHLDDFTEELLLQRNESVARAINYPMLSGRDSLLNDHLRDNRVILIDGSEANDSGALISHRFCDDECAIVLHAAISRRSVSGIALLQSMLFMLNGERDDTSDLGELSKKSETCSPSLLPR